MDMGLNLVSLRLHMFHDREHTVHDHGHLLDLMDQVDNPNHLTRHQRLLKVVMVMNQVQLLHLQHQHLHQLQLQLFLILMLQVQLYLILMHQVQLFPIHTLHHIQLLKKLAMANLLDLRHQLLNQLHQFANQSMIKWK